MHLYGHADTCIPHISTYSYMCTYAYSHRCAYPDRLAITLIYAAVQVTADYNC